MDVSTFEEIAIVLTLLFLGITGFLIVAQFLFKSSVQLAKRVFDDTAVFQTEMRFNHLRNLYESYLKRSLPYYNSLSQNSRFKFLRRLHRFLQMKEFRAVEGFEINDEMKILVSASAVQLTLGLDYYLLDYFEVIVIHPDVFHSPIFDQWHKGHTNPGGRGSIVFSWKHFKEGYETDKDRLNLGLHEMAHALDLSRRLQPIEHYFNMYYHRWLKVAEEEFRNIHNERASFLRSYAGVNIHEFFAVSVEYFFEDPAGFKEHLPEEYKQMTILLRQDPLINLEKKEELLYSESNDIPLAETSIPAVLTSSYSPWANFTGYLYIGAALFFMGGIINSTNPDLLIPFIAFSLLIIGAITYARFEIRGNYLLIKKPWLLKNRSFALENIVSVRVADDRFTAVSLNYLNKGEIKDYVVYFSIKDKDLQDMLAHLREKKIPVY